MIRSNDLSRFTFIKEQTLFYGIEYRVKYTTGRGDYYVALLGGNGELISATLLARKARVRSIKALRDTIKSKGLHYNVRNERI